VADLVACREKVAAPWCPPGEHHDPRPLRRSRLDRRGPHQTLLPSTAVSATTAERLTTRRTRRERHGRPRRQAL